METPTDKTAGAGKVALVNMPFGHATYPSIQLGTLAPLLKARGFEVHSHYLNLCFAQQIGFPLYDLLCEKQLLLGEWLFSRILFKDNPKHHLYPRTFKPLLEEAGRAAGCSPAFLEEIEQRIAPQFLTWAQTSIDWGQYRLIGFTSMFHQNVASVTLAKLIKDLYPDVVIVFGGAHYDGDMGLEYFRAFPWIDYIVVGEGELPFPALAAQVCTGQEGEVPDGVAYRENGAVRYRPNTRLFSDFARMGPPDYDDYFEQLERLNPASFKGLNRILLYESARGCWWGEKHHCTFCGLNAQSMKFRAKTADQVFEEMRYLSNRYDTTRFRFVDNIIDMTYIDEVFGKLAEERYDLEFFIETKSNLGKRQIQTLARGGVKSMQPGIESLSQATLKEMDKGVSPLQNLQCLRWSGYYGIDVSWNILLGFPGETDEDYRKQIDLIPAIRHLQPPESVGKLWLERFSPYFTRPHEYGIRITGPGMAYEYVYDPARIDLGRIAYDFEYEVESRIDPHLFAELMELTADWKRRHASGDRPFLFYAKALGYVTVYDGRAVGAPARRRYEWPASFIIDICSEAPKSLQLMRDALASHPRPSPTEDEVRHALARLLADRVLYEDRGRYLTLAIPMNPHH
jgi:ribosomal peptide maturation radical SAM protein 1